MSNTKYKIWMVRAGERGYMIDEFISEGIIAIGWDDIGEVDTKGDNEKLKEIFKRVYPDFSDGKINQSAGQVWKFASGFKKGDKIVSYDSSARVYYTGTLMSDYQYLNERSSFKHVRRVKWDKESISRDNLNLETRNTLGSILTIFEISEETWMHISHPLNRYAESKEKHDLGNDFLSRVFRDFQELIVQNVISNSKEFIKDYILNLEWDEVEDIVAGLLRAMGYRTNMTTRGGDLGSDIFASPDGLGMIDPRIKVEVKHRKKSKEKVGAPDIRNFVGGMRGHHNGIYVSTTGFSQEAKYEAERANFHITMVDPDRLVELIVEYYEQFDPETKALIPLKKVYWPV